MCDTLAVIGTGHSYFAKNSDRPVGEPQVVEAHPRRAPGPRLATQYLEIEDEGAYALVGSRPTWLWGFEHGVNEHRVAIGNEKLWTLDSPRRAKPALIGMDLVRLGLERGATAREALEVMTGLLERHGQGGVCEEATGDAYYSSFLIADPRGAWVLETSGREWAAREVTAADGGLAISNRISLPEFEHHRHPTAPTGHADRRLEVTTACVAQGASTLVPADLARTMRDHGGVVFPGEEADPATGDGVTVCMHVRGYQVTAASLICDLAQDPTASPKAWAALGSPCVSVYVPVSPLHVPPALGDPETWKRFDALRARVEADPSRLGEVRRVLAPLEAELWQTEPGPEVDSLLEGTLDRLP